MYRLIEIVIALQILGASAEAKLFATPSTAPPAPRVIVDKTGGFEMVDAKGRSCEKSDKTCREPLTRLSGSSLPLFISDRARVACGGSTEALVGELERAFSGAGKAYDTLRKGFDEDRFLNAEYDVIVVLDHFGSQIEKTRSFFLPDYPEKYLGRIVLDCQSSTRIDWAGLLAHELAHVALTRAYTKSEAWQEEMIAQLLEAEAGGTQPERNLRRLEGLDLWPGLSPEKPGEKVSSPSLYAHSYLFGKYLMRVYGGWSFIRDLTAANLGDTNYCLQSYSPFHCAILTMARNGSFVETGAMHAYDFSAQELITKFALATALNVQQVPWLWIGGRHKLKTLNAMPVSRIGAHQFFVVDASVELPRNSSVSVYVLGREILGRPRFFQTLANARKDGWTPPTESGQARLLIINETDRELSLN